MDVNSNLKHSRPTSKPLSLAITRMPKEQLTAPVIFHGWSLVPRHSDSV